MIDRTHRRDPSPSGVGRQGAAAYPGLYHPSQEHDACGTGFIANISGERTHRVVELAVEAVINLTHRGAVSADAESGDGAGVTIQLPFELLRGDTERLGHPLDSADQLAVAMLFLPREERARAQAREILEAQVREAGVEVIGWREVPTDPKVLGGVALETLPGIEQLLMARPERLRGPDFDRALYLARRRAEREYRAQEIDCYIVSMSSRTVVYKGLMVAPQLAVFFPDLADERAVSSLALFHQRFATNTLPNWPLAQPFRFVAHNGEINTLLGNRNWMTAREPELTSGVWGDRIGDLFPVIQPIGSDTASLDEALELLTISGRDILHSMMMLIPEAWENMPNMDPALRAFYEYHACLQEPWDGPAAVAFTDGNVAAAIMDRNGLRPARYQVTSDGLVVMGSEVGLVDLPFSSIVESGRIGPGEMIAVDTRRRQFLHNQEIKSEVCSRRPYADWVQRNLFHLGRQLPSTNGYQREQAGIDIESQQVLHGYTHEEFEYVIKPMVRDGKEPTGSMGDDTPLSALQDEERLLYTYFKQKFAQVTNPAIDSIREEIVMALDTLLGRRHSLLETAPEAARLVHLTSPLMVDDELTALRNAPVEDFRITTLHARFPVDEGPQGLERGLDDLCAAAEMAIDEGHSVLVISDRLTDEQWAPIPMLLAVATVHHHLIATGRRMRASIVAEAGDARDVHHFACLIGFGAAAVNPYLVLESLRDLYQRGEFGEIDFDEVMREYGRAIDAGILKIMSKMGISAVSSYHGAQIFEALGIAEHVVDRSFPGTVARVSGIGFEEIGQDVLTRHARAFPTPAMPHGGWYKYRRDGDFHANAPQIWRALHQAAQDGSREDYRAFVELVENRPPTALRDLLRFRTDRPSLEVGRVEAVEEITRRFNTGAMSLGALSPEAHEDIARAMNILGGRSNTGEGGEDPERYNPDGARRDANSKVKQVASGRFGVTPAYLAAAQELEIKIAQGSKPGEGGQLPGHKVSSYIATLRHVMPGTPLISPPPHHDIYSIEDLSQLIYDLKTINPEARVCVKLVAAEGVGTIAAGVAKAYADVIQISGADGGTGASPWSSIKYAGSPWELGISEVQQVLVRNRLRGRVTLRTDGGFHTGRDVLVAAMLGAEEYGFGTPAMIAVGCKMARQCHLNTCPVGVATQREDLREKYFGTPEMLVHFLRHVAQEVRELLAELGYQRIEDVIGRSDLLEQIERSGSRRADTIDLSRMIAPVDPEGAEPHYAVQRRNDRADSPLDDKILADGVAEAIERGTSIRRSYRIRNIHRAVGARVSGRIAGRYGDQGLPDGTIELQFSGSAGQSFGAFLASGVQLHLIGEANDYVAKGMNGGEIIIQPPADAGYGSREAVLVGNTVLYGATGGNLFVAGAAGERFGVRNSGGRAVVEGIGDHGCEYMTDGVVVILGETGRNFGAGMSNGVAYVLDERGDFRQRVNQELVGLEQVTVPESIELLEALVRRHQELTGSLRAKEILDDWRTFLPQFWKVVPKFAVTEDGPMTVVRRHLDRLKDLD